MKTIIYLYEGSFRAVRHRLSGIYTHAWRAGWNLRPVEGSSIRGGLDRVFRYWNANGCIAEGGILRYHSLAELKGQRVPVVWCDVDEHLLKEPYHGVRHDSSATAEVAVRELLARDSASYGFVGEPTMCDWSKQREDTFVRMMSEAGRRYSVFETPADGAATAKDYYSALGSWLCTLEKPAGVFAANDETGELVLGAARMYGVEVPKDVAVIGVDDDELVCENMRPTLASIVPEFARSGEMAAELLDRLLANPRLKPQVLSFGYGKLVPRASIRRYEYADHAAFKAIEFIRLGIGDGIGVDDVARYMKTGRRSAEKRFRKFTGHSIKDELDAARFRRACDLAARPNATLKEIHLACGYSSPRALRELFRRHAGCSISEWRKRERAEAFAKMPHNGSRKV